MVVVLDLDAREVVEVGRERLALDPQVSADRDLSADVVPHEARDGRPRGRGEGRGEQPPQRRLPLATQPPGLRQRVLQPARGLPVGEGTVRAERRHGHGLRHDRWRHLDESAGPGKVEPGEVVHYIGWPVSGHLVSLIGGRTCSRSKYTVAGCHVAMSGGQPPLSSGSPPGSARSGRGLGTGRSLPVQQGPEHVPGGRLVIAGLEEAEHGVEPREARRS